MLTQKNISVGFVLALLISSCTYSERKSNFRDTTTVRAYPKFEPVSKKNTEIDSIRNINRPKASRIIDPLFSRKSLFGIWVLDPTGPVADFELNKDHFYVADYDGNGAMPYVIRKDSITVYYQDYIQRGLITKSTSDSLSIAWDNEAPVNYVKWTQ